MGGVDAGTKAPRLPVVRSEAELRVVRERLEWTLPLSAPEPGASLSEATAGRAPAAPE